jgi:hypothetical protein
MSAGPDQIGQRTTPQKSFAQKAANAVTTREGLVSDHDYAFLFKPNLSVSKKRGGRLPSLG